MLSAPANALAFSVDDAFDRDAACNLYNLQGLDGADCDRALAQLYLPAGVPNHLRKISCIAIAGTVQGQFLLQYLDTSDGEKGLLADFFRRFACDSTMFAGYDSTRQLDHLRCRAFVNGVTFGEQQAEDVSALLSGVGAHAPPLNEVCQQMGLPHGPVLDCLQRAVQVYLLSLRLAFCKEQINADMLTQRETQVRTALAARDDSAWPAFAGSWRQE